VREAVFSVLDSLGVLEGAVVWDLFCGSGAMGIESLSRGAHHATFVDHARPAIATTKANLATTGYGPAAASVVCADALAWSAAHPAQPAHAARPGPEEGPTLVLADPPYAWAEWSALLDVLAHHQALVVMETGSEPGLPEGWSVLRAKRYGGTVVTLTRFAEGDEQTGRGRP